MCTAYMYTPMFQTQMHPNPNVTILAHRPLSLHVSHGADRLAWQWLLQDVVSGAINSWPLNKTFPSLNIRITLNFTSCHSQTNLLKLSKTTLGTFDVGSYRTDTENSGKSKEQVEGGGVQVLGVGMMKTELGLTLGIIKREPDIGNVES